MDDTTAGTPLGLLVMAHGGTPEWNAAVEEAVAPLRLLCPVALAFGMAERSSLQAAIEQLEVQGVRRVAAVGLFIAANSFRDQTEYLLGIRPDPPEQLMPHNFHSGAADHSSPLTPVKKRSVVVLNRNGLYDSTKMREILAERVLAQSRSAWNESVLLLAHGAADDGADAEWLMKLEKAARHIRKLRPFRSVKVETLREDWQEKRRTAEQRVRDFVQQGSQAGGRVIVVPVRLSGFGPYREVLKGLSYISDGRGLLPHPYVTEWIKEEAAECFKREGWLNPLKSGGQRLKIKFNP